MPTFHHPRTVVVSDDGGGLAASIAAAVALVVVVSAASALIADILTAVLITLAVAAAGSVAVLALVLRRTGLGVVPRGPLGRRDHVHAPADHRVDVVVRLELVKRPLDGALGHAELGDQRGLGRERPVLGQLAAVDPAADDRRDLLVDGHGPVRIDRHAPQV